MRGERNRNERRRERQKRRENRDITTGEGRKKYNWQKQGEDHGEMREEKLLTDLVRLVELQDHLILQHSIPDILIRGERGHNFLNKI